MANQYYNKISLATGEVLMDLSQDDIKPEHVDEGIWFHDKTGERKKGSSKKTVDASEVTAEASEVLAGKTFGKGNSVETGTMPDHSGKNVVVTSKDGTIIPRGAFDGTTKAVLSDEDRAKLIPENIKEGVTILDVEGNFGADDISAAAKEVTPSFEEQVFNPADDGATFYSSVKVNAIPITRTDNEAGGVTVTIG